jgi:hypothetical protein
MNTITTSIRRRLAIASLALAVGLVTACGPGSDPVVDACERLDECNALNAGISVDECIQEVDVALQSATPSERNDWATLMNGCLQFDTCNAFISCVDANGL